MVVTECAFDAPVVEHVVGGEGIFAFRQEISAVFRLRGGVIVCAEPLLPCGKDTITHARQRRAANAYVPGGKTVVEHTDGSIFIVDGGAVEWIALYLPPVLPSRMDVMIVIVVSSCHMV